jgi:hypothetical protein
MALVACAPTFKDSIELGYVIVQGIAHAFGGIVVLIDGQSPPASNHVRGASRATASRTWAMRTVVHFSEGGTTIFIAPAERRP